MPGWVGSDRRARLPVDWSRLRVRLLRRDRYTCRIAGPRCTGRATEVDHVDRHGNDDDANLQAVCRACHPAKSGREGNAARPSRRRPAETHPGMITPGG